MHFLSRSLFFSLIILQSSLFIKNIQSHAFNDRYTCAFIAQGNIPFSELDFGPASLHFQKMGKQAQLEMGIPVESHVPIRKINPHVNKGIVVGLAHPEGIFIDEEVLNRCSFYFQQFCLRHEAAHIFYDILSNEAEIIAHLTEQALTSHISPILFDSYLPNKMKNPVLRPARLFQLRRDKPKYIERRADLAACKATRCAPCLRIVAQHTTTNTPDGYLNRSEIEAIAKEQEKMGYVCRDHANPIRQLYRLSTFRMQTS